MQILCQIWSFPTLMVHFAMHMRARAHTQTHVPPSSILYRFSWLNFPTETVPFAHSEPPLLHSQQNFSRLDHQNQGELLRAQHLVLTKMKEHVQVFAKTEIMPLRISCVSSDGCLGLYRHQQVSEKINTNTRLLA